MVNTSEMTTGLIKELAFSKEELKELENARKKLYLMMSVLKQRWKEL